MESRMIKPIRSSPLLLKDHLLDDMSSCSSNGFKSFPRRQCCTTVRFLHEIDRKNKQKRYTDFKKPPPKSALSALQRVITAVKRLPFAAAAKSPEKKKSNFNSFLPRSFSKRIFKRGGFWKRKSEPKEIEWKSFDQLLKEDSEASDRFCSAIMMPDGSKSYSCWGNDFAVSDAGDSSSEENLKEKNDAVAEMPAEEVRDTGVVVTNDDVSAESTTSTNSSTETIKKQWPSDQEKEQFSPVSVLDCPFDDDDEVSSPFQHRLARMEGARKKLLKKIQRFECLAKLEPVNLAGRFSSQPESDNESSDSTLREEEEEKAFELLDQMKESIASHHALKVDNLMLDFFKEGIANGGNSSFYDELVKIAGDWVEGQKPSETFVEWEVEKNRQAYVRDMEKSGEWKSLDQENEEVVLELGDEVFAAIFDELVLDITS